MKLTIRQIWICAFAVCLACKVGLAQEIELTRRYIAPLDGFSLKPPANTDRIKDISQSSIIRWEKRDAATGAIAWTLSVHNQSTPADLTTEAYGEALSKKFKASGFEIESQKIQSLAGADAIHITGQTTGMITRWKKQVWIRSEDKRFLILVIAGPTGMADQLEPIFDAVVGTMELIDRAQTVKDRQDSIDRGGKLLTDLTGEKLVGLLHTKPQWFLFSMDGETVGFMKIVEAETKLPQANAASIDGVTITQWLKIQIGNHETRMLRREAFSSADRKYERWSESIIIGQDQSSVVIGEEGLRQANLIVCTRKAPGREKTNQKSMPPKIDVIYLPHAMGYLLPRLADLSQPGVYGFGAYSSEANDFDLRTFTVKGQEKIDFDGRFVTAIALTDQKTADQEPADVWVDTSGLILKMDTADGLSMQRASLRDVKLQFRDAEPLIRAMNRMARDTKLKLQ